MPKGIIRSWRAARGCSRGLHGASMACLPRRRRSCAPRTRGADAGAAEHCGGLSGADVPGRLLPAPPDRHGRLHAAGACGGRRTGGGGRAGPALTLSPGGAPARATPARLVTRVVVGLAAIQAGGGSAAGSEGTGPMGAGGEAWGGAAAWAAGALSRPLADGSTRSSHWLLGGALAIAGLQVLTGTADMEQRAALDLQPAADPSLELA